MTRHYRALTQWLSGIKENETTVTFTEIENILGFQLPDGAKTFQGWWTNPDNKRGRALAIDGWRATAANLESQHITFVRDDFEHGRTGLTVSAVKYGLTATYGIKPSQVTIAFM